MNNKFPNCVPMTIGPDNNENKLCCTPRIREPYDKVYTFGVDRKIKNFKNCGYIYYQRLPKFCPHPINPKCDCRRSYYDANPKDCLDAIKYDQKQQAIIDSQLPKFKKPKEQKPPKKPSKESRSVRPLSYQQLSNVESDLLPMRPSEDEFFIEKPPSSRSVNQPEGLLDYQNYPRQGNNLRRVR